MICIDVQKAQLKFALLLEGFKRLLRDASGSLFLTKWKHVDKENVVSVENSMIPEVLRIQNERFENQSPEVLLKHSKKMKKTFYVIKSHDKPVGYCIYYIKPVFSLKRFKKKSVIHSIAIDRNFQRKGLGERLLRESIKEMRFNGITSVLLYVNVKNPSAINLYKKIGFQIIKKVKDTCGISETCYEMELKLAYILAAMFLPIFFVASFFDNIR